MRSLASACLLLLSSVTPLACAPEPEDFGWRFLLEEQPGALLSVAGTGSDDIWIVGADRQDGSGPTVLHYDGERFSSHEVGDEGDLWWIVSPRIRARLEVGDFIYPASFDPLAAG